MQKEANVDLEELNQLKKNLPVGKCLDVDMEIEEMKQGMRICRTGENDFEMKGKGEMVSMKGSVHIIDYKKE